MKLTMPNGIILEGKYEEVVKACKELRLLEPDHVQVPIDEYLKTEPKMPWEPTVIYGTEQ